MRRPTSFGLSSDLSAWRGVVSTAAAVDLQRSRRSSQILRGRLYRAAFLRCSPAPHRRLLPLLRGEAAVARLRSATRHLGQARLRRGGQPGATAASHVVGVDSGARSPFGPLDAVSAADSAARRGGPADSGRQRRLAQPTEPQYSRAEPSRGRVASIGPHFCARCGTGGGRRWGRLRKERPGLRSVPPTADMTVIAAATHTVLHRTPMIQLPAASLDGQQSPCTAAPPGSFSGASTGQEPSSPDAVQPTPAPAPSIRRSRHDRWIRTERLPMGRGKPSPSPSHSCTDPTLHCTCTSDTRTPSSSATLSTLHLADHPSHSVSLPHYHSRPVTPIR